MNRYLVKNPENKIYHVLAADQFEAIHKAKRIDSHIYSNSQYKIKLLNGKLYSTHYKG
jgi:predicted cupin superfamily sugar epimerase